MNQQNKTQQIEQFAKLVQQETFDAYRLRFPTGRIEQAEHDSQTTIKPGKKYVKVDIGSSGKFMIDAEGNIFGIKAYGVIHRGHQYGTLDTTDEWNWGDYTPFKRAVG